MRIRQKAKKPHKMPGRAAKKRRQKTALGGLLSRVKGAERVQQQGGYVDERGLRQMRFEIDRLTTANSRPLPTKIVPAKQVPAGEG